MISIKEDRKKIRLLGKSWGVTSRLIPNELWLGISLLVVDTLKKAMEL